MLLKEFFEDTEVRLFPEGVVSNKGSHLRANVGDGASEEGSIREAIVQGEQELSGSAILELSHELNACILEVGQQVTRVELTILIFRGVESVLDLIRSDIARLEAGSSIVILIILEG